MYLLWRMNDEFHIGPKSDEKYTHRSTSYFLYQIKGYYVFSHFPGVVGQKNVESYCKMGR